MGRITYCVIDETDPLDEFECEGEVIKAFFSTSPIFDFRRCRKIIRLKSDIERKLKSDRQKLFNIFHFAAHGTYFKKTKKKMDYSVMYRRRGIRETEIFRPDTIVRAGLQADVFISTCCQTFNDYFIETIGGYGQINNYIAPKGSPLIGDTIVFALMFYNDLIRKVGVKQRKITDTAIIDSFATANHAYRAYGGDGKFRLYNCAKDTIYE